MKIGFALEYSLGHSTHAANLKQALSNETSIQPIYFDIPFDGTPLKKPWSWLPPIRNNWSARASLVAYERIRSVSGEINAAFFHTQVTSLFSSGLMKKIPSIVSIDATPLQYDALGSAYNHGVQRGPLEAAKKYLNVQAFQSARRIVAWSEWAKCSLVVDYNVDADKVVVIPPGIDLTRWTFSRPERPDAGLRILFVGGDFPRKGGDSLLASFELLKKRYPDAHLDIVTKTPGIAQGVKGAVVHYGLTSNSPSLLSLYEQADIFAFPTRGDCLPLAIMEAMAAGLPVVATDVGAISEAVVNGKTGLIVPVDDSIALGERLIELGENPILRAKLSKQACIQAELQFNARINYGKLVELLKEVAS